LSIWNITPAAYLERNREREFELINSFHTRAEAEAAKGRDRKKVKID
jgi:hypothetical protein